jgi:hypothetical protein
MARLSLPLKLATLACIAAFAAIANAQETAEATRGPDGGTTFHVAGIEVLPVAGKPFFAKDSIEWGPATLKTEAW